VECRPSIRARRCAAHGRMMVLRLAFPRGRALVGSLLYGLFNFAGSVGLGYYGLVHLHAGLVQILLALVPLATLLLAVLWRQERLERANQGLTTGVGKR
jgi:drug/metabolite transporter (DMT)-like permease